MMNILRKYKTHFRLLILLVAAALLFIFKGAAGRIDSTAERAFYLPGSIKPDTNIIIIHISQDDIQSLNGWPLKRSYYALLINQLNTLKCRRIGIEVFLSPRLTSQSLYNDVLINEISRTDNVVLSSLLSSYDPKSESAEILLPAPKLKLPGLKTGHINYYEKDGIYIPLEFKSARSKEPAFSLALSGNDNKRLPPVIKLNFYSSWKQFRNFSLMEMFDLFESGSDKLKLFEGKTVLIGVSSPQAAQTVSTMFDKIIPGVAIHAFSADNIIHNRYIRNNYMPVPAFIIIILLTLLILYGLKDNVLLKYALLFAGLTLLSFILFRYFYIELQYALFIVPLIILFLYDGLLLLYERNLTLESEADVLRIALRKKESHLSLLQKELDITGENSDQKLLEKISSLKKNIENLKLNETDQQPAVIETAGSEMHNFMGIVYKSSAMAQAADIIQRAAPVDATVLITGESGTGKELAARAIHELSSRRNNSFVAVNCAALSDTLLESELFGHVKGAFTNAIADKTGRFEAADMGTIFLDEIGETSENFQVKLLRILQSGEYEKVGSAETRKVNVRIVAATNKKPENLIREKKFREDLFYRLNIIRIEMPPLRERKEDIEVLVKYFLSEEKENIEISAAALNQLKTSSWKGNVRELESVIKRAAIFARSSGRNIIRINDLPEELSDPDKFGMDVIILDSLRDKQFSHSSINEIAEESGISRTLVSENFRGIVFRNFYESGFSKEKTIEKIAEGSDAKAAEKVKSKVTTFLHNIEKDIRGNTGMEFPELRRKLSSKYKNLPQKYHRYLDEIIRYYAAK